MSLYLLLPQFFSGVYLQLSVSIKLLSYCFSFLTIYELANFISFHLYNPRSNKSFTYRCAILVLVFIYAMIQFKVAEVVLLSPKRPV